MATVYAARALDESLIVDRHADSCEHGRPMPYERKNIQQLHAYVPGQQPQDADIVKLNTNENPYPPAPAVLDAVHAVTADQLRRYPPPLASGFRTLAAELHGVEPSQVIATNGGDELLRMLFTAFCEPHRTDGRGGLAVTEPTYSLYPVLAGIQDANVVSIPLGPAFDLSADFAARANDAGAELAILVNPHAPSGRLEPVDLLREVAEGFDGVLVIDEAYVDFAEQDALSLVRNGGGLENVVILRTMSKGYSLAGLRFGYGIGHEGLIACLDKVRDSYNTDIFSQAAAMAALRSRDAAEQTWRRVTAERTRVTRELRGLGYAVPDSQTNFVLAAPPEGGMQAAQVYEALADQHIFVRYFDEPRLVDRLRITIGTPEQNDRLLSALRAMQPATA